MQTDAEKLITARFETVLYDLDGTLIDSAKDMQLAVSNVLADHGLPPVTEDDVRIFMGQGSKVTMGKAFAKHGRSARRRSPDRRDPRVRALLRGRPDQPYHGLRRCRRGGRALCRPRPEARASAPTSSRRRRA
jgi:phosphoglycolate phosphatase